MQTGYWMELAQYARRLASSPSLAARLLLRGDVSAFYANLGDDLIPFRDEGFADPEKPLWLNFGYWREARTFPDACVALVRYVAEVAELGPRDEVLDVRCGYAEQEFVWVRERYVAHVVGLDATPVHVDVARSRVAAASLERRIAVGLGDACRMPFATGGFDKVTALECAFHFQTREAFLKIGRASRRESV